MTHAKFKRTILVTVIIFFTLTAMAEVFAACLSVGSRTSSQPDFSHSREYTPETLRSANVVKSTCELCLPKAVDPRILDFQRMFSIRVFILAAGLLLLLRYCIYSTKTLCPRTVHKAAYILACSLGGHGPPIA